MVLRMGFGRQKRHVPRMASNQGVAPLFLGARIRGPRPGAAAGCRVQRVV